MDYDVVVIGSGFGGSVMACRLAEKGLRVCLLERGRRYGMHEFPRRMDEVRKGAFWDPDQQRYGLFEFRNYPESDVISVCASGLGGGSLIYANVLMRMPAEFFGGWPGGITRSVLDPYYDRGLAMLEASPYPFDADAYYRDTPKAELFRQAAAQLGTPAGGTAPAEHLFPHLAIRFDGAFPGHQGPNAQGAIQSRCTKCGECDLGCNIHAKNTLDLNYLTRAKNHGAEIRTHALVDAIRPRDGGYVVTVRDPRQGGDTSEVTAGRVVLSAGSLGSTALLLRMKRSGHLPHLSPMLGRNWCGNGDLEGTVIKAPADAAPSVGPVITSAVRFRMQPYPDGYPHGMFIQDAGLPGFLTWYLSAKLNAPTDFWRWCKHAVCAVGRFLARVVLRRPPELNVGRRIADLLDDNRLRQAVGMLGMGRDRTTGHIELRADDEPVIRWDIEPSRLHYNRVRGEMKRIATAMGGKFMDNPLTYLDKIIAVHPLGGCCMGDTAEQGVVAPTGEVHGHPGLYVVDAAVLPTSVGPNPSLTITAVAEYMADRFPA